MINLGKDRNAQRILSELSEYISCFTDNRMKIYYLNAAGRERVQAEKVRKKTAMVTHFLIRNDLFIISGRPSSWKNEVKITMPNSKVSIVADAVFTSNKISHFVEIDYKQSMNKNVAKIKKYTQLASFNSDFKLVWVTITPYRKKKLESLCSDIKCKVYLWDEIR
jgi:hypothetical protein